VITLNPLELGLAILVIVLIIALIIMMLRKRRDTADLKNRFGPEFSRTLQDVGDERKAAAVLHEREKRVSQFDIRPVSHADRERFSTAWTKVQAQFVDDPAGAVSRADVLLGEIMETRGYPVTDFNQRSADLSVDHPAVVQNYRAAHDIATNHARGAAGTEDLRQAMIHYRTLFDDLVIDRGSPDLAPTPTTATPTRG
jgi:hypothetical protein